MPSSGVLSAEVLGLREKQWAKKEEGAMVVEFAISLLFLFFFLSAFFTMVMIFLGHERLHYASYVGARANAVGGRVVPAVNAVHGKRVQVSGAVVYVSERLLLPFDFANIYHRGDTLYVVKAKSEVPLEPGDSGDNAY